MKPQVVRLKKDEDRFKEALLGAASELQADILSKRKFDKDLAVKDLLNPSLDDLPAGLLKGADRAASRIVKAIKRGEQIGITCAYGLDVTTAAALLDYSITQLFQGNPVSSRIFFTSNETNDGFNPEFTKHLSEQVPAPTLLITLGVDQDECKEVKTYQDVMRAKGMIGDAIVVDNKPLHDEYTPDVFCYINPNQEDCLYPTKSTTITLLTLITIIRLRRKLVQQKILRESPKMGALTPYGACSVFAGFGDLRDPVNRAFVKNGLAYMNSGQSSQWEAYQEHYLASQSVLSSQTITANLATDVRSGARQHESGYNLVKFLQAEDVKEAKRYLNMLSSGTKKSTKTEREVFITADYTAAQQNGHQNALSIYLPSLNSSSHKMLVDKLFSKYGKPVCVYTPKEFDEHELTFDRLDDIECDVFKDLKENIRIEMNDDEILWVRKGIGSLIPLFSVVNVARNEIVRDLTMEEAVKSVRKNIFQGIKKGVYKHDTEHGKVVFDLTSFKKPKLSIREITKVEGMVRLPQVFRGMGVYDKLKDSFDGYRFNTDNTLSFEADLSIMATVSDVLKSSANEYIEKTGRSLVPYVYSDGGFPENRVLDLNTVDEINQLEPFGFGFSYPQFEFYCQIERKQTTNGVLNLRLNYRGATYDAIWTGFEGSFYFDRIKKGDEFYFVARPTTYIKNGKRTIRLDIVDIIS
ncbi:hypothetical protein [Vibrio crassostreae]|uniref:hypothetical protein n=1 Tax=Vibrio crassostreae TaxID=246167 RepID=UPI001B30CC36|nr:hypothetical protein [Vibrio crassostreae]